MSLEPKVHNKYHRTAPADAVYIGRGSKWGNPFVIGRDGDREEVCEKFEDLIMGSPYLIQDAIQELRGKSLVCFCKPARCHGDFLLRLVNV